MELQDGHELPAQMPRVLSVQSHVVHGYVGNRAAVFPLQLLGFEVDVINSVQFSCHTGYPAICGQKLGGDELKVLVDGLATNDCLHHNYLLTGYIGTASFLREVVRLLDMLPKSCRYICDPVLGDNGKMYTSPDLVDVYREEVLPHVSVLTPNQFEAELLTKLSINSIPDAVAACDALHKLGVGKVILTTLDVPDATKDGTCVAMLMSEPGREKWLLRLPFISGGPFTGTGDLTTAMLLAWTSVHPDETAEALEKAGAVLQAAIRETVHVGQARTINGKRVPPELRIISCKAAIERPPLSIRCRLATPLSPGIAGVLVELAGLCVSAGTPVSALDQAFGLSQFLEQCVGRGVRVAFAVRGDERSVVEFREGNFAPISSDHAKRLCGATPEAVCSAAWDVVPAALASVSDGIGAVRRAKDAGVVSVAFLPSALGVGAASSELAAAARFTISALDALSRILPE